MYAVALVFSKNSSIVTEIWVDIEAQNADEAIGIASASCESNKWRMQGYAIVNSAAVRQDPSKTIAPESTSDDETIVEVKPRRRKTPVT